MKSIANFAIRYRWGIIVFFIGLSVLLGSQMKNASFNADMMTYMPEDMPSRIEKQKIEDLFGGTEMIMIIVESDDVIKSQTLKRVRKLSRGMVRIKGVESVMSIFETKQVRGQDGAMVVDPAVRMLPLNEKDIKTIKSELSDNELVMGSLVSKDFSTTAIIGVLEPELSDKYIVAELNKLIEEYPGDEVVTIGGTPYTRVNIAQNMMKDIVRLLPLGLLLMLVFLFLCFRQARGVWLPFVMVLISIFVSMGLMPLVGWQVTAVTIILPVLLIAVANDYGIHMMAKYQEDNTLGNSFTKGELANRMISSLGRPIILAGVTTIVGLLCLMGHILIPAGQIGVLAAVGIAVALIASLVLIPAITSVLPKARPLQAKAHTAGRESRLQQMLTSFGKMVTTHPKRILVGALLFTLICGVGLFRLVVDTNPIDYFTKQHPVVTSTHVLTNQLGGYFPLSVVFKGDIKDPDLMKKIDEAEKRIAQIPEVGATTSIAKVVRQISRAINDKADYGYNQIPDTYNAVAQYLELYLMSGDPDDLEKMVDFNFQHAMILLRFRTASTPVLRESIAQIREIVGDDASVEYVGGNAAVFSELDLCVVNGQLTSLGIALMAVFLMLWVMFRSVKAALLSILPLALSMVVLFGIMGHTGIVLNMVTALLSSIMIGVGIDYTIHYLWRYRSERKAGFDARDATIKTLQTTGRGIIFNALSVIIGFTALLISSFLPVRFFGALVVITIAACLVGALLIVPALCLWLRPAFLEPDDESAAEEAEVETIVEKQKEFLPEEELVQE